MDAARQSVVDGSSWLDPGEEEGSMWLAWLVRLRWVAIAAQIVTVAFAVQLIDQPTRVIPLLGIIILVLGVANAYASKVAHGDGPVSEQGLLSHLALDVAALTGFFVLAGGPDNPFTSLYLVHIAMGAVMLSLRLAGALSILVVLCYSSLFVFHLPLHFDQHVLEPVTLRHVGKLAAFVITLGSVAGFTLGLARSLRARKLQLLEARDRTARTDRLRSVGTLAAGAAHELNTPLSTIGLRLRRVGRRHHDADTQRDLEVIRDQLQRCSRVVSQLLVGAGDPSAAGIERRPLVELVQEGIRLWDKGSSLDVELEDNSHGAVVELPRIAFVQAFINLLENGRQAQEQTGCFDPIRVHLDRMADEAVISVQDRGCGLPENVDQVGEPFFTTKPQGTGLGVFVARQVADGAGGGLTYLSAPDGGTIARWRFPAVRRRNG